MAAFRVPLLLVLAGALAVIAGALAFQYIGGLQPCELCLAERWPYYIGVPVAALALAADGRRRLALAGIVLVAVLFASSSALAFYHVGVEQHWFAGPTACTTAPGAAHTIAELKAQLMAQPTVRCDEPQWILFRVSLAGWNLLASLALAGLSLWALRRALRAGAA